MHIAFLNPQGNFDRKDSFLTEHPDFGGQLVYVKETCLALARQGVQVDIVTRRIDDPDWPRFSEQTGYYTDDSSGPRIVRIDCGGSAFLRKEHLWPHLEEFVENILVFYGKDLPDAFTAHYADGGYCAALLRQRTGRSFTFTAHSLGAQKLDKLGMQLSNAGEMEEEFHFSERIAAERLAMQTAARIITSTSQERLKQYAHPLYQGAVDVKDDTRFSVIPPGVNTRVFTTTATAADAQQHVAIADRCGDTDSPYIVCSSRLDEKKNILGIVRAYAGSCELQEMARLGLFIRGITDPFSEIGNLPAAEQAVLQPILDTISEAAIRSRVDFFDIRSQQALAASYRYFAVRGSVFALTAYYEPFGLAPIEAAACGLAIVATRNGGPVEIFADGSGLLVDPFDDQDIARGLHEALLRQQELAQLGIRRVRSTYTWDRTAELYRSVLESMIVSDVTAGVVIPELGNRSRIRDYLAARDAVHATQSAS